MRALIIDDDARLADMVQQYLTAHGWQVSHRETAAAGRALLSSGGFDALILDLGLPDKDGLDLCRELRGEGEHIPVLMLTARGDDTDRILGLELGADDYLPKPFNPRELLARLRAITRRGREPAAAQVIHVGGVTADQGRRIVTADGREVDLTGHQFDILWALMSRAGRVLSRDQIMQAVRGEDLGAFDRSIDVHISRIRQGIEVDLKTPTRILTVRGAGYVYATEG